MLHLYFAILINIRSYALYYRGLDIWFYESSRSFWVSFEPLDISMMLVKQITTEIWYNMKY